MVTYGRVQPVKMYEREGEHRQSEPGEPISQQEIESGVVHNRPARAALRQELRKAKRSTGTGANHSSGHQGLRLLPSQNNVDVEITARNASALRR